MPLLVQGSSSPVALNWYKISFKTAILYIFYFNIRTGISILDSMTETLMNLVNFTLLFNFTVLCYKMLLFLL